MQTSKSVLSAFPPFKCCHISDQKFSRSSFFRVRSLLQYPFSGILCFVSPRVKPMLKENISYNITDATLVVSISNTQFAFLN